MYETVFGIIKLVNPLLCANAFAPMYSTNGGSSNSFKEQYSNAYSSILIIEEGNVIEDIDTVEYEYPLNAFIGIFSVQAYSML